MAADPTADISGKPVFKPALVHHGADTALRAAHVVAATVDTAYISRQVTRMEQAVDTDPELAIGTAKELLETVCKTILDSTGAGYDKNDQILALVKKTTAALQLSRDDVDPTVTAADTIRRILSSLAQIAQGTAELRNSYGTGHGRPGQSTGSLGPRHARLVVGATATLASFLLRHLPRERTIRIAVSDRRSWWMGRAVAAALWRSSGRWPHAWGPHHSRAILWRAVSATTYCSVGQ